MSVQAEARRLLIGLAQKRQRAGSGSGAPFLNARTVRMQFPDLTPVFGTIPWAVVGAVAARLYMPERNTQDLDVLVLFEDAARVQKRLREAGFTERGRLSIGGGSWTGEDGFPLDVIECRAPWCEQALRQAQSNQDASGAPVLPLPFLVLMKFGAGRVQDLADVTRMLGQASPEQLSATRAVFARWEPEGADDLESLITLGQLEMQ